MGTTSGDIWLDAEMAGDGPFALRSISGDVTIVGRSGFRVEAETITGDLSSELRAQARVDARPEGPDRRPPWADARSSAPCPGDLQIVQPRDAAPEALTPPTPPKPPSPPPPRRGARRRLADVESTRLEILRELERGDITVAEATDRLARLDEVVR